MTSKPRRPTAPSDLGPRARRFWRDVYGTYSLNIDEHQLLIEACRTIDLCEALAIRIAEEGEFSKGSMGQLRVHPAVPELRQARALLGGLLTRLKLPEPPGVGAVDAGTAARAKAQGAVRANRAAHAANIRWTREETKRGSTS